MIKNNLSSIMGAQRIKITELADKASLNKNTVLNMYHERSTRIEYEVLNKLCKALGCQPGDLLEYIPDDK